MKIELQINFLEIPYKVAIWNLKIILGETKIPVNPFSLAFRIGYEI